MTLGSYLMVYMRDEAAIMLDVKDESMIDAAVEEWHSSGGTRDKLVRVTLFNGADAAYLASSIRGWVHSTQATRRRSTEVEMAADAEEAGFRKEFGQWETP